MGSLPWAVLQGGITPGEGSPVRGLCLHTASLRMVQGLLNRLDQGEAPDAREGCPAVSSLQGVTIGMTDLNQKT